MLSELGQAALRYATEESWYVFPLAEGTKGAPLIKNQVNKENPDSSNSSRDPDQITRWWTAYPRANIGLDCGRSGLVVVDGDTKHDGPKLIEYMKLVSGGRRAWETRKHETPSGGCHYLFAARPQTEGSILTKSGTFGGPGIDTRARGGYIVLPPSVIDGKPYRVIGNTALKAIPKELLLKPGAVERDDSGRTETEALLASQAPIKDGTRNQTLHRIGSKQLRLGLNKSELTALLLSINKSRCVPPLNEIDVHRIVKSIIESYKAVEDLVGSVSKEELDGIWNDQDQAVAVALHTFLEKEEEPVPWLLEGVLPMSSLNMIMGSPKSGKSTLTRNLAVAVATGQPFLGRIVSGSANVLYYSLQERKEHLRTWLRTCLSGYEGEVPIDFIFRLGRRGAHATEGLRERLLTKKYGLVVLDMASRFVSVKSLDDYAETERVFSNLAEIAEESGACIVFLHHERKSGGDFEGGIGSQAIRGACYTTIKCSRDGKIFTISSEQREGEDLESTKIEVHNNKLVATLYTPSAIGMQKAMQNVGKK